MQHTFVATPFRDALFLTKKPAAYFLPLYYATGMLSSTEKTHCIISYSLKDGKPYRGLLLPTGSLIGEEIKSEETMQTKQKELASILTKTQKKHSAPARVAITWQDIVHFSQGIVPEKPTGAYTEGRLCYWDSEKAVIEDPRTLLLNSTQKTRNHPAERNALFLVIPLALITRIEIHDI